MSGLDLLLPFLTPRSVLLHVGAGDGSLALRAASYVERVYAVGLTRKLASRPPLNLRVGWPPPRSVDVAFSEHLEESELPQIRASLAPGGKYLVFSEKSFFPRLFPKGRLVAAIA